MRITMSFILIVGLGCGFAQPAWAQTKQNAWQRLTGVFKSKNQKDEAKTKLSSDMRVSPTTPHEGRGIVFVEEPREASVPQATDSAAGAKTRFTPPAAAGQRTSMPPAVVPPLPGSQPIIVESATPGTPSKIVAPPVTATPASNPKTAAPVSRANQSQTLVIPPTPAKNAKGAPAGRDVSRLTRQVSQACAKARNVKLTFTSATEVTVEMDVTTVEECNRHAEQIFAIRELDPYRVNLKFNVPQN